MTEAKTHRDVDNFIVESASGNEPRDDASPEARYGPIDTSPFVGLAPGNT